MNIKKIISILVILIVSVVIISSIILFILYEENRYSVSPPLDNDPRKIEQNLKEVNIRNDFYAVKNCIEKFYNYYSKLNNVESDIIIRDEEAIASIENQNKQNIEAVYNILDNDYIKYKNITIENVKNVLPSINKISIDIEKMYVTQKTENISIYFVYGYLIDTNISQTTKFSMIVKIDMLNRTYTLLLEDYLKENYNNLNIGENVDINYTDKIEKNNYNTFKYSIITDEDYILDLFNSFKDNIIYNQNKIYENLEQNYKQKRFANIKEFEEYVKNNKKEIFTTKLSKYQKNKYDNYTQYVCFTENNKYYIFNETSTMNYELILDTYTIDLPEFIEKYEKSNNEEKIKLNVEKIKLAINEKNYNYIYNKLDETFKNNNYPTINDLKTYFTNNSINYNNMENIQIKQEGKIYIYTGKINEKTFNIIMQLKEGTDFTMSFSYE